MQLLITLITTQTISTIIALTEFKNPEEIIALSLELTGIAVLLLLIRLKQEKIQRLVLLCQAVLIFVLLPTSQFKYFTGVYHLLFRLVGPRLENRVILAEWVVLILVLFVFGTDTDTKSIIRSVFTALGLIILQLFKMQPKIQQSPQIVVHSKINYTLPNEGSNPRSVNEKLHDQSIASLYLDDQFNILGFNNSMNQVFKLTENDMNYLLDELIVLKIDSLSKTKLQWKNTKQQLKVFLEQIRNHGTPMTVLLLDYKHPQLKEHLVKIIFTTDFEIQFHDLKERDQFLKQRYLYTILKQLFSTLSHEFGTSLNYLLAIAQVAIEKYNNEMLQYFQPIRSMGMIMHHFILDMVDYNDILGKKLELQLEKIDIRELLEDVMSIFSHTLLQKGLSLTYEIDLSDQMILTDGRRLKQILINLIQNSQKFTYRGGVRIIIKPLDSGQYIQFEVIDTGVGLTRQELDKLQEMLSHDYKQESKISNNTAGFGLGSFLSNKIAQSLSNLSYENGGGIKYYNNIDEKGTRVVFKIKNQPFSLAYTMNVASDNSSGILKVGKNAVIDLRQSQIEMGLSGFKKPLTRNLSTVMVPKVKSFHENQVKDYFGNRQQTKEIVIQFPQFPLKDSIIGSGFNGSLNGHQTICSRETQIIKGRESPLKDSQKLQQKEALKQQSNFSFTKELEKETIQGKNTFNATQAKDTANCFQTVELQYTQREQGDEELQYVISQETNDFDQQKRQTIPKMILNFRPNDVIQELKRSCVKVNEQEVESCNCKRILIVDDEMINILGITIMLKQFQLEADKAFNGQEALEILAKAHCMYSIIIMDINMPLMDGLTATRRIIEKYKLNAPKIIACTAFTDSDTKQRCYDSGMCNFLNKPVNKVDLQRLLTFLLN